jgi:diguanylate cyclase (GGDEF)-like protein
MEQALRQQAAVDPLTGLPNRRTLLGRLAAELDGQRRCTALFCDIDGFKEINDRWGHDAGDELLNQVAARLSSCVRSTDVVSRFGGDEFVIMLSGGEDADVDAIIERIRTALSTPYQLAIGEITVGVSIGVAGRASGRADDLVRAADFQMYKAKQDHGPTPTVRVADAGPGPL